MVPGINLPSVSNGYFLKETALFFIAARMIGIVVDRVFSSISETKRSYITHTASFALVIQSKPLPVDYVRWAACALVVAEVLNRALTTSIDPPKEERRKPSPPKPPEPVNVEGAAPLLAPVPQPAPEPAQVQESKSSVTLLDLGKKPYVYFPETRELLETAVPGRITTFLQAEGWDLDFFIWAMRQHRKIPRYDFFWYSGKNQEELEAHLKSNPKSVVFISDPLQPGLEIPSTTYLIFYCNQPDAEGVVKLPPLTENEAVRLFTSWISDCQAPIIFEDDSLRVLFQHKEKSLYSWIDILMELSRKTPFNIINSLESPGKLFVYRRTNDDDLSLVEVIAATLQREYKLNVEFHTRTDLKMPVFLSHIRKGEEHKARAPQWGQINGALGAADAPHAVVLDCNLAELERMVASPLFKQTVLKLDMNSFLTVEDREALIKYLRIYPKTLLYVPSLAMLIKNRSDLEILIDALPWETRIVGQVSHQQLKLLTGIAYLEKFKKVRLVPLTREQCLEEIKLWTKRVDERVLKIAVEMSFLLNEGDGSEFMFTKDLIERVVDRAVTIEEVWSVFMYMHQQIEKEYALDQSSIAVEQKKCRSLLSISLELKKLFGVVLPTDPEKPKAAPGYLIDLNEKVKDKQAVALALQDRLDDLEDALSKGYKNAMILGPSGVGKTTLIKLAAWMAANNRFGPEHPLYGKTFYQLDMLSITSDIMYMGTFEKKINAAFNFLRLSKNAVLFIDEIHKAMGAGASSKSTNTLSQHMKEFLEGSDVSVIGATTWDEHEELVAKDTAFGRRFNTMELKDPTDEQALQIFSFYCASEAIKKIYPPLAITEQNIQDMLEAAKKIKSKISIVDRSKKVVEAVATAAKRLKSNVVNFELIHEVAQKLII